MIKRMAIMLVAVGIVFGGLYGFQTFKARMIAEAIAALQNPPQTVSTTVARSEKWQTTLTAVGSTRAIKGADLLVHEASIVAASGMNTTTWACAMIRRRTAFTSASLGKAPLASNCLRQLMNARVGLIDSRPMMTNSAKLMWSRG